MVRWNKWYIAIPKKRLLKKIDLLICVSEATACYALHALAKKDASKIKVIYNGINLEKFNNIKKMTKRELRKKLNIELNTPVFLTVCNLIERKGVDIVLNAMINLNNANINFKHIIIGRGKEEEKLRKKVAENGLNAKVVFIPYIEQDEDLMSYFAASDIFIMMSRTLYNPPALEGFGIVYAEAQYLGIPVIAGKSGGVISSVRDGFTGYLINPESPTAPDEIAKRIDVLLKNKEKYKWMSNNAKLFIVENFSWKKNADEIIQSL